MRDTNGLLKVRMMQVEIKILSKEQIKKEIAEMAERVSRGKGKGGKNTILLTSELFPKIFSQKRLELLITLAHTYVGTVSELARQLNRPFEVVYRDLKLFESYDLVKLTKKRRSVIPSLTGEIHLPVIA